MVDVLKSTDLLSDDHDFRFCFGPIDTDKILSFLFNYYKFTLIHYFFLKKKSTFFIILR